ncbi:hypothetical protein [Caballeronia sp. S22]|uniref:hypothetical protein n=1 Tax=Caballeronia sp. S22 TaxID=3137182 RepID=UPI0035309A81
MDRQDEVMAAGNEADGKERVGELARRAASDLADALVALQQVRALFAAIEAAAIVKDTDQSFLLAQVGKDLSVAAKKLVAANTDFFFAEATR